MIEFARLVIRRSPIEQGAVAPKYCHISVPLSCTNARADEFASIQGSVTRTS